MGSLIAQYDYQAGEVNELSFVDEQQLLLLSRLEDDGWWLARLGDKDGLVPSNYVKLVDNSQGDIFNAILTAADNLADAEKQVVELTEEHNEAKLGEQAAIYEEQSVEDPEITADLPAPTQHATLPQSPQSPQSVRSVSWSQCWSASLHMHVGQKPIKGHLAIIEDDLTFLDRQHEEYFRVALNQVISYDDRKELLLIRDLPDPVKLCLREGKEAVKLLQSAIHAHPISPRKTVVELPQLPPRPTTNTSDSTSSAEPRKVKALYEYEPMDEDELKVEEGEELLLLDSSSADWWLCQRQHGSKRQGLVPRLYVQEIKADQSPLATGPKEKPARPTTPRPAFLDELLQKRQRVSIAEEGQGKGGADDVIEVETKKPESKILPAKGSLPIPAPPPLPKMALSGDALAKKKSGDELASKPLTKSNDELSSLGRKNSVTQVNWQKPSDVPKPSDTKPSETKSSETKPAGPRQLVPKEVLQKSTFKRPNSPKVKPEAAAAIAAVLERGPTPPPSRRTDAKQPLNLSNLKHVSPIKKPSEPGAKANPWSAVTLKKTGAKPAASPAKPHQPTVARAQPSRPDKAVSADKPQPANCRLWTNRTGQFQVEAEYVSFANGQVTLHKLNGNRIQVPLAQLCERDCEFVHRKEGLPYAPPPAQPQSKAVNLVVNGHDWQAFFNGVAGLDAQSASRYAAILATEGLDQRAFAKMDRPFLLARSFNPAHLESILNHLSRLKLKQAEQNAAMRNLSALSQEQTKEAPRRPSAVFQQELSSSSRRSSIREYPSLAPKPAPTNPSTLAQLSGLKPNSPPATSIAVAPSPPMPYTYTQTQQQVQSQMIPPPQDPFASIMQQSCNGSQAPMLNMQSGMMQPNMMQGGMMQPNMQMPPNMMQAGMMQAGMMPMQFPNMQPLQYGQPQMMYGQPFYGQPQMMQTTTTTTTSSSSANSYRPNANIMSQPYADANAGDKYAILRMIDPQAPSQFIEDGSSRGSPNQRRP